MITTNYLRITFADVSSSKSRYAYPGGNLRMLREGNDGRQPDTWVSRPGRRRRGSFRVAIQQASACYGWFGRVLAGLGVPDTPWRVVDLAGRDGAGLRAVPDVPGVPSAEELSALPHARAGGAAGGGVPADRGAAGAGGAAGAAGAAGIRRTSSRPPSSDSPYEEEAAGPVAAGAGEAARRASSRASRARRCAWSMTRTSGWSTRRRNAGAAARAWPGEPVCGAAPPPGHRHQAAAAAEGDRVRGAVQGVPVLRDGDRAGAAARTCGRGPATGRRCTRRPRT